MLSELLFVLCQHFKLGNILLHSELLKFCLIYENNTMRHSYCSFQNAKILKLMLENWLDKFEIDNI